MAKRPTGRKRQQFIRDYLEPCAKKPRLELETNGRHPSGVLQVFHIPELLHDILACLPIGSLECAGLVNRFWYNVALPLLYRDTTIRALGNLDPDRRERAARGVQSLHYTGLTKTLPFSIHVKYPRLKSLLVGCAGSSRNCVIHLTQILRCPTLTSLYLTYRMDRGYHVDLILLVQKLLKDKSQNLQHLSIAALDDRPVFDDLAPLLDCNSGLEHLESFEIMAPPSLLMQLLPSLECVSDLTLHPDGRSTQFLQSFPNSDLKHLRIYFDSFENPESVSCQPLSGLRFQILRTLALECNSDDFTDQVVEALTENSPQLRQLRLGVQQSSCSIASLNAVGQFCRHIEILTLPEGSYELSDLYEDFPCLQSLDFGAGWPTGTDDPDIELTAAKLRKQLPSLVSFKVDKHFEDMYSFTMRSLVLNPSHTFLRFSISSTTPDGDGPIIHFRERFSFSAISRLLHNG